jgi:hypothetical protein
MQSYETVQYSGPVKINESVSLTLYQGPNPENDRRIDDHILQAKPSSYPKNPVPMLDSPYMDRIPQEMVQKASLSTAENQRVFLENGAHKYNGRMKSASDKPLAGHPVAQLFVGCVTVLGLFVLFRSLKL